MTRRHTRLSVYVQGQVWHVHRGVRHECFAECKDWSGVLPPTWIPGEDFVAGDPLNAGANAVAFHISFPRHPAMARAVIKVCVNRFHRAGARYSSFLSDLFKKDFAIPMRLSHPNIIQVLHHYNGDFSPFHASIRAHPNFAWLEASDLGQQSTFVVLPYVPRTLIGYVNAELGGQPERLPEREWLWIALQLFRAVAYLRTQGVVHRDIKADNVLLHPATKRITLIDFGEATELVDSKGTRKRFFDRIQLQGGAIAATAPEVQAEQAVDTDRAAEGLYLEDVYAQNDGWAAGRCLLSALSDSTTRNAFDVAEQPAPWMTAASRELLQRACHSDRKLRLAAGDVVSQLEEVLFVSGSAQNDPPYLRAAATCHRLHNEVLSFKTAHTNTRRLAQNTLRHRIRKYRPDRRLCLTTMACT